MKNRFAPFFRSEQAFFVLLPLLFLLLVPFVVVANPSLHRINFIANLHLIGELRFPTALLGIMGSFLGLFFYSPIKELASATKEDWLRILTAFCFALGFGNLLFGVISSFLGILLFFVLGLLIPLIGGIRERRFPSIRPRLFIVTTALFVVFGAITLLYTENLELSGFMFQRGVWIFVVPLIFGLYPPDTRTVKYFSRIAMLLGYVYMLLVALIYVQFCLSSGNSLLSAFGFNKLYFVNPTNWPLTPHHILRVFGFEHYTYILFVLSAPLIHALFKNRYPLRVCCYGLAFLGYTFILQSRIWMLLFFALVVGSIVLRFFTRRALVGAIATSIVLITSILAIPNARSFFDDPQRSEMLRVAAVEQKGHFWQGTGLGSSREQLVKHGIEEFWHFHNEFVTTFVETGIFGLLLLMAILLAYGFEALRRRNYPALLLLFSFTMLLFIDDIIYQTHYCIGLVTMLSLYIQLGSDETPRRIGRKFLPL